MRILLTTACSPIINIHADTNNFLKFNPKPTKSEEFFPINNVFDGSATPGPLLGLPKYWIPVVYNNAMDAGNQPRQTGSTAILNSENSRGSKEFDPVCLGWLYIN